jgi:gluconate 2-dehydrogenase gamma chain
MQNRRKFLQNTAYGTLGVYILERALGKESPTPAQKKYKVLTPIQAKTLEAITECIWPSSPKSPGAIEAGVVTFIDRSLSEFHHRLKTTYQNGIASTNAFSHSKWGGDFPSIPTKQQNEILAVIEQGSTEARNFFTDISPSEFFELLLAHTRQGLFSDPSYGGNQNFIGWKSIGYPGPRFLYTAEMQTKFAPLELPLRSLADM